MNRNHLAYYFLEMQEKLIDVPYLNHQRRVRILLPKGYRDNPNEHYPVLYMHDGQNVFYSKESYSGYSWKVIPTIKNNPHLPKMIVVGIDNAGSERLNEYSPWKTDTGSTPETMNAGGLGERYGEWVVKTVKPLIDQNYRTSTKREHTLLAGSSMGGMITAYMGAAYPDVFGHLGVFSLASWFSEPAFLQFIHQHPLYRDTKVYIQVGTKEGDEIDSHFIANMNQAYIDCTLRYYQALMRTGSPVNHLNIRIMANKNHHERHWAHHFLEFLGFALM